MPNEHQLEIITVPCLSDNYAYLVKGPDGITIIDAPEAAPIISALEARGWQADTLLITHHHHDHHGGTQALRDRYGLKVFGPKAEADRLPPLDVAVEHGFEHGTGAAHWQVLQVAGHTLGHIAYHYPQAHALFSADSLMVMGCGRLFEGTPTQMWETLAMLLDLPDETQIYSGHEYTASNMRFALSVEPENRALLERAHSVKALLAKNLPTVPARLDLEKETNPFLRAPLAEMKQILGLPAATDAQAFAELRRRKDIF